MKTDILRETYLSFFQNKDHKLVGSSSLAPEDDPTLLFTGAGMNQFKEQFRGNVGDFRRAVTCQKCLRTDDLEKVGKTPAHHTFFEMLGNFSFGNYFKREAIFWAWEFLTEELKIDQEKLWISVYKDDVEAFDIWHKEIGVPEKRIVKLGEVDNFWPSDAIKKGPNGPCGPCSEIFYDQGSDKGCKKSDCSPACDCRRFVEIWNLVFTQFERKEGAKLDPLPNKNIDTGMGLERMASVLQGVSTNFEIDILMPVLNFICAEVNTDYKTLTKKEDVYCICDHVRAVVFAICENILPSNEERGYVIRKIIRKASMHARNLSKTRGPFLHKIVPVIAQSMGKHYPELKMRQDTISRIILAEEKRFAEILENSEKMVETKFSSGQKIDTGKAAFELYDTFGTPIEVTKEIVKRLFTLEIDEESFNNYMSHQKNLSRAGSQMKGDVFAEGTKVLSGIPKTDFKGYATLETEAKIILIAEGDEKKEKAQGKGKFSLILDKTPFYAQKGGQAPDKGIIETKDGAVFKVEDTKAYNDIVLHEGFIEKGVINNNSDIKAIVNKERRKAIAKHHTATHLLQSALRKILGAHVEQAGSFVDEDRLRFDFTHFKGLSDGQLLEIENTVNEYIKNNYKIEVQTLDKKEAMKLGALALFGEKYEDTVRVIIIDDISKEFCGGTHLNYTGEAELFKIKKESAVSAGVRRIEAVCGKSALKEEAKEQAELDELARWFSAKSGNIIPKLTQAEEKIKELEKKLTSLRDKGINDYIPTFKEKALKMADTIVIIKNFSDISSDSVRNICDKLKEQVDSYAAVFISKLEDKISLIVSLSKDNVTKGLNANVLVKEISKLLNGSGGGRPDFAQAGARNNGKLEEVISGLPEMMKGYIK
ncbi:MAG: alanine--tRNA ligase [Candidatus Omnitrophota bacterium]